MKTYSIGRDLNCNIVIDDNSDVISRRHATLNVSSSGKMTIVDQSHNGTYVNGIRIASNVPVPVTRKDNVSFAHVARLDWNQVPKTYSPLLWVAIAVGALVLLAAIFFGIKALGGGEEPVKTEKDSTVTETQTIVLTPEQVRQQQDSIRMALTKDITDSIRRKAVEDSLALEKEKAVTKASADSAAKAKEAAAKKAEKRSKKQDAGKTKKEAPAKEEKPKQKQF